MSDFDQQLDTRGMHCPMPVLKTKKALAKMQSGEVLQVLATDPASKADLAEFARQTGHRIVSQEERDGELIHLIRHK